MFTIAIIIILVTSILTSLKRHVLEHQLVQRGLRWGYKHVGHDREAVFLHVREVPEVDPRGVVAVPELPQVPDPYGDLQIEALHLLLRQRHQFGAQIEGVDLLEMPREAREILADATAQVHATAHDAALATARLDDLQDDAKGILVDGGEDVVIVIPRLSRKRPKRPSKAPRLLVPVLQGLFLHTFHGSRPQGCARGPPHMRAARGRPSVEPRAGLVRLKARHGSLSLAFKQDLSLKSSATARRRG